MKKVKTRRRYEITDSEWERIKDLVPPEQTGKAGRPSSDNRTALNGMLWIDRTGAPWEDLPNRYGAKSTVHDRFKRWTDLGMFEKIFDIIASDADMQDCGLDSTSAKVHQHAAGEKKGSQARQQTKE
jgi:transposase